MPCKKEASYALLAVGTYRSPSACAACSLLRDNLSPFYLASLSASFLDCASQAHLFSPWNQTTTFSLRSNPGDADVTDVDDGFLVSVVLLARIERRFGCLEKRQG